MLLRETTEEKAEYRISPHVTMDGLRRVQIARRVKDQWETLCHVIEPEDAVSIIEHLEQSAMFVEIGVEEQRKINVIAKKKPRSPWRFLDEE